MIVRGLGYAVATVVTIAPFGQAQAAQASQAPAGWTYRLDGAQELVDGPDMAPGQWRYTSMPPGWHVTTTEQGVLLFARDRVLTGRWGIEVELFLFPNPGEAGLGVVVEAADRPEGSLQLQFVMRRDGAAALLGRHDGVDSMLVAWTSDSAVAAHTGDVDKFVLRVVHDAGALAFSINGHEMFAVPTGGEGFQAMPGLRVGPGLNVHVARFDLITPLAPPRRR